MQQKETQVYSYVWHLNDTDKLTFAQIAIVLEQDDSYWNEQADEEIVG